MRQERVVHHTISFRRLVVVIAQQGHRDLFLLRPRLLREGIVAADSVNSGVQTRVSVQPRTHFTHLRRTRAGERHGKEEQQCVSLAEIVTQPDLFRSVPCLCR